MANRFFKVLYAIALLAIIVSIPVSFIDGREIREHLYVSYKVKCTSNDKYVVLQGSQLDEYYTLTDNILDLFPDKKKELNFYCQYYSDIQKHILAYLATDNRTQANIDYFEFRREKLPTISAYPTLYELERVKDSNGAWTYGILEPLVDAITYALVAFGLLQIIKFIYVYIVFGEVVLHPFKQHKSKK